MLTRLSVVNSCLSMLGEIPLTDLSEEHPLTSAALNCLDESLVTELHRQWWFNTDYVELTASTDGYIYVPADSIAVHIEGHPELVVRGRRLYDRFQSTYKVGDCASAIVVRSIPFEDLPVPAQMLVKDAAVLNFQLNYDADSQRTAALQQKFSTSYQLLNAEHTRQIQANGLSRASVAVSRLNAGVVPRRVRGRGYIPVR